MKNIFKTFFIVGTLLLTIASCKEDEENELFINFKTTTDYTYANQTLASGDSVLIGIDAGTEKTNDPVISFSVSEAVNGGASTTVYTETLEETDFQRDFTYTMTDATAGNVHKLTFVIVNRDGIDKQNSLEFTVE